MSTKTTRKERLRQLNEYSELLNDIEDRLMWAESFAKFPDIKGSVDELMGQVGRVKEEVDELIEETNEAIAEHKVAVTEAVAEVGTLVLPVLEQ